MIAELAQGIRKNESRLDAWYRSKLSQISGAEPPIYTSVDLRNSGFKIAVVDTNLFPSGFNNLCETFSQNASKAFRTFLDRWHPQVRSVLIFPEEHTRNPYYWKSIANLQKILVDAGLKVQIGSASTLFTEDPHVIPIDDNEPVTVEKVFLENHTLRTRGFVPDLILLNNDLSAGTPDYLKDLRQVLLPSPHLGWYRRRKDNHFLHYQRLIDEAAEILNIDPWHLSTLSAVETGIDLDDQICLKRLAETADRLLLKIRQKYVTYGIRRSPYLFIKNNAGTYGMGIIHVESGAEVMAMNRRTRSKLASAKGGQRVAEYLLQEGVPTADLYQGKPLEPVVYLVGGESVGTFFRIHESKNERENLNAPGMSFACLCLHKVKASAPQRPGYQLTYEKRDELYVVASLLGRIASLAAVYELTA